MALMSLTAGKSLSSHDHRLSAVTVWYVGFPFGPATAGLVDVANIENAERRTGEVEKRFVVARSIRCYDLSVAQTSVGYWRLRKRKRWLTGARQERWIDHCSCFREDVATVTFALNCGPCTPHEVTEVPSDHLSPTSTPTSAYGHDSRARRRS